MRMRRPLLGGIAVVLGAAALGGCATPPMLPVSTVVGGPSNPWDIGFAPPARRS